MLTHSADRAKHNVGYFDASEFEYKKFIWKPEVLFLKRKFCDLSSLRCASREWARLPQNCEQAGNAQYNKEIHFGEACHPTATTPDVSVERAKIRKVIKRN